MKDLLNASQEAIDKAIKEVDKNRNKVSCGYCKHFKNEECIKFLLAVKFNEKEECGVFEGSATYGC